MDAGVMVSVSLAVGVGVSVGVTMDKVYVWSSEGLLVTHTGKTYQSVCVCLVSSKFRVTLTSHAKLFPSLLTVTMKILPSIKKASFAHPWSLLPLTVTNHYLLSGGKQKRMKVATHSIRPFACSLTVIQLVTIIVRTIRYICNNIYLHSSSRSGRSGKVQIELCDRLAG